MDYKTKITLIIFLIIYIIIILIMALFIPFDQSQCCNYEKLGSGFFGHIYKLDDNKAIKKPKHLLGLIGVSYEKGFISRIPECDNVTK